MKGEQQRSLTRIIAINIAKQRFKKTKYCEFLKNTGVPCDIILDECSGGIELRPTRSKLTSVDEKYLRSLIHMAWSSFSLAEFPTQYTMLHKSNQLIGIQYRFNIELCDYP